MTTRKKLITRTTEQRDALRKMLVTRAEGVKLGGQDAGGAVQPPPGGRDLMEVVEEWQGVLGVTHETMLDLLCRYVHAEDPAMAELIDDRLRELAESETAAGNILAAE